MKRIFAFDLYTCEMRGYVRAANVSQAFKLIGRNDATIYPAGPGTPWPGDSGEDLWIERHAY